MVDKTQWPVVDPGFVMVPPKQERHVIRPRVRRIKSSGEARKRGPYQCKRCFRFGHIEKTCREPPTELGAELPPSIFVKSRKRKEGVVASSCSDAAAEAPSKSRKTSKLSSSTPPVSPRPTTRSMGASPSTPTSTGPVTRRRTAEMEISPGGIAQMVIIN